jgi:NADPH:quinone reductase
MQETKMQKILVTEYGGPEVLKSVSVDVPHPQAGLVVVDVEAAGVNYVDVYQRSGLVDMPMPYTPGFEGVGKIRELGPGVEGLKVGGRVAWINNLGSYAGQISLPAVQAIPVPETFSIAEALLFQGVTAQFLLAEYRTIRPGEIALVHAAAGGVGQLLVQWLKHLGAIVIATASNEEKLSTVRALGADHTVNYSNGFLGAVMDLSRGRGVDLALDAVGAATFADTVKSLAPRGTAIAYGQGSGVAPDVQVLPLILKGVRVAGGSIFGYIEDPNEMQARAAAVVRGIQEGWLRIGATTNFALGDAAAAHRAIEGRTTKGKLALIPESHR